MEIDGLHLSNHAEFFQFEKESVVASKAWAITATTVGGDHDSIEGEAGVGRGDAGLEHGEAKAVSRAAWRW